MPDILIRGTYFPCNGHRVFRIYADGRVESEYTGILLGAAIELPAHGDLVERERVLGVIDSILEQTEDDVAIHRLKWVCGCVRKMPIAVLANKEETE